MARLHCENIDQGFLATLGPPFLELLYEAIDADQHSVLIVKQVNGIVVGFVSGSAGLRPIYKRLLLRPFDLFTALMKCFLSLSKLANMFELLLLSIKNPVLKKLPQHELLTIAVDPKFRGKGYAEELFASLCLYFTTVDVQNFKIVVGGGLARAHAYYLKMGCTVAAEVEIHKGKQSLVYVKHCG